MIRRKRQFSSNLTTFFMKHFLSMSVFSLWFVVDGLLSAISAYHGVLVLNLHFYLIDMLIFLSQSLKDTRYAELLIGKSWKSSWCALRLLSFGFGVMTCDKLIMYPSSFCHWAVTSIRKHYWHPFGDMENRELYHESRNLILCTIFSSYDTNYCLFELSGQGANFASGNWYLTLGSVSVSWKILWKFCLNSVSAFYFTVSCFYQLKTFLDTRSMYHASAWWFYNVCTHQNTCACEFMLSVSWS